jgi:hypothetical protein
LTKICTIKVLEKEAFFVQNCCFSKTAMQQMSDDLSHVPIFTAARLVTGVLNEVYSSGT